jgi:hypothetical protein
MMNIQIKTKENHIICTIQSLKYSDRKCQGRNYMDDKRVKNLLISEGHNPGEIIKGCRVDNCNEQLEGVWIFEDLDKEPQIILEVEEIIEAKEKITLPKVNTRRKNSRKAKKVLDNS